MKRIFFILIPFIFLFSSYRSEKELTRDSAAQLLRSFWGYPAVEYMTLRSDFYCLELLNGTEHALTRV